MTSRECRKSPCCAIRLRLEVRARPVYGLPVRRAKGATGPFAVSGSLVANPLNGMKVHWTFILFRFVPGLFRLAGVVQGSTVYEAEGRKRKT